LATELVLGASHILKRALLPAMRVAP